MLTLTPIPFLVNALEYRNARDFTTETQRRKEAQSHHTENPHIT